MALPGASRRRLPLVLLAMLASGCTHDITVMRADGWQFTGPLTAAEAETVTIQTRDGPVVIPRREVIHQDMPGNGQAVIGASIATVGLGQVLAGDLLWGVGFLFAGFATGGHGLIVWTDARTAWDAGLPSSTDSPAPPAGMEVRF